MEDKNLKSTICNHIKDLQLLVNIANGFPGWLILRNLDWEYIQQSTFDNAHIQKYHTPANLIGKTIDDIFPKHITKYYKKCALTAIDLDKEIIENKTYSATGEKHIELFYNKPFKNKPQGKIIGVMAYTVNISFLKQTASQLFNINNNHLNSRTIAIQKIYCYLQNYKEPFKEVLGFIDGIEKNIISDKNKIIISQVRDHLKILLINVNEILKLI